MGVNAGELVDIAHIAQIMGPSRHMALSRCHKRTTDETCRMNEDQTKYG